MVVLLTIIYNYISNQEFYVKSLCIIKSYLIMAKIALLGGSFNPPHLAHQMIILWLLSTKKAERVWLLPCFEHPFGKKLVDFEHRISMCKMLAKDFAHGLVEICSIEEELGGASRTLFSIQQLQLRHPEYIFSLVIGADILLETNSWYGFDQIKRPAPMCKNVLFITCTFWIETSIYI